MKILEIFMVNVGKRNRKYAKCQCECGKIFELRYDSLGKTKSCGCLKKEQDKINLIKNHKHKLSHTKIWRIYFNMKSRCYNTKNRAYANYGGRGITVCDEWLNSFENFVEWSFNNGFEDLPEISIDRIDNNLGYSPDNCRWVNAKMQARNRRSNVIINYEDEKYTGVELSEKLNIPYSRIISRVSRGNDVSEITSKKYLKSYYKNSGEKSKKSKLKENEVLEIRELYSHGKSLSDLSNMYKVHKSTIHAIVKRRNWKFV